MDSSNDTYVCTLNNDGSFNSCSVPLSAVDVPASAVTFATVFSAGITTQYAYVSALGHGVVKCDVNTADGSLLTCGATPATGAPTWVPFATCVAWVGANPFAYVTENSGDLVYKCAVNSSGAFTGCAATPGSGAPWATDSLQGITIATVEGAQYAYVGDSTNGMVYKCTVNATSGTLGSCSPA